ncbi:equilibrative nucleobase transporter 1-like [Diadema setosum]|uniref:equilibrative nucleobase transporter 1-like n=1 Tax=Diadema setosum TaxID=31175 RepID=UPI003B3B5E44
MKGVVLVERFIALILACLENLVHGGLIFGWASLFYVLKDMGYFAYVCPESSDIGNTTTDAGGPREMEWLATNIQTGEAVTVSCPEQDAQLQLVYSLAIAAQPLCMFPVGYFFDRFGTLLSRLILSVLLLSGYLLMAFSSAEYSVLIFPATILFTIGGVFLILSSLQVGNLFPSQRSTAISIVASMYGGSVNIFLIQKTLYKAGFAFDAFFFLMAASVVLMGFNTTLCLPRTSIPRPLPSNYRLPGCSGLRERSSRDQQADTVAVVENNAFVNEAFEADEEGNEEKEAENTDHPSRDDISIQETAARENGLNAKKTRIGAADLEETIKRPAKNRADENRYTVVPNQKTSNETMPFDEERNKTEEKNGLGYSSLISCIHSTPFWLILVWQMFLELDLLYTFGTVNYVIEELAEGDKDVVSSYLNVFSITQAMIIIVGPLSGLLMDRNKLWRFCRNKDGSPERTIFADLQDSCLPLVLTSVASLGYSICLLIPNLELQYLTFVFILLTRPFFYCVGSAVIAIIFPAKHFISVYGAIRTLSGIFSFLQYPIFLIQQHFLDNNPFYITIGFIIADALTLFLPIALYTIARRRRAPVKSIATS